MKVQKKDGRLDDFDRSKILAGLIKSGATPDQAETITKQVEGWIPEVAVNGMIRSSEIRVKALEALRIVNPQAAANFETYKKPTT